MIKRDPDTELCVASAKADPEKVSRLVSEGADVNALGSRRIASVCGQSPLWIAVKAGSEQLPGSPWRKMMNTLNDPFPKKYHENYDVTRERCLSIIKTLLDAGADLERRSHGTTPLRMAVFG